MPNLSFLTNYFDIPIAVGAVILLLCSVQVYHLKVPIKLQILKSYLSYILLIQTAIEAITLLLFGVKGGQKSTAFYTIATILLTVYLIYASLHILRDFKLLKWRKSIKNIMWAGYIGLFIILAVGPFILDMLNVVSYIVSELYLNIFLIFLYSWLFIRLRHQISKAPLGVKLIIPLLIIEIFTSALIFYLRFFDLNSIANETDPDLNTKLFLLLIGTISLVLIGISMGISFVKSYTSKVGLMSVRNVTYYFSVIIVVFLTAFIVLIVYDSNQSSNAMIKEITEEANVVSVAVDTNKLEILNGKLNDLNNRVYYDIKDQLTSIANDIPGIRYIYIYGTEPAGHVVNYVETQPDSYKDKSTLFQPGDVYIEASAYFKSLFQNKTAGFEGPYKDSYGVWYSKYTPIETNNGHFYILGIDTPASVWLQNIFTQRAETIVVMLFVFMIIIIAYDIYLIYGYTLTDVEDSQRKFKNVFEHSSEGILLLKSNKIIDANKSAANFFGLSQKDIIGENIFNLSPERQANGSLSTEIFSQELKQLSEGKNIDFDWKFIKNEKYVYATISLNKMMISDESVILMLLRDVTQTKIKEKKKEKYVSDLEVLNKLMIGRELKMIQLKEEIRNLRNQKIFK